MCCKVYSHEADFVCSFTSVLFLFKEVFGAFSVEKGEKYHKLRNATWFGNLQIYFHLEDKKKEKSRNEGCLNVHCALSLPHLFQCYFLSLKSILPPICIKRL